MRHHPKDLDGALALHVAGDLPPGEANRLEEHLTGCPACRHRARSLAEALGADRRALGALGRAPVDAAALARIRAGVLRRIEAADRSARPVPAPWKPWLAAALGAALVLAALGTGLWLRAPAGDQAAPPHRVARTVAPAPFPGSPVAQEAPGDPPAVEPVENAPPVPPAASEGGAEEAVREESEPSEPMVIQVVSDDPEIVYYWLIEPEESEHAALPSRSQP